MLELKSQAFLIERCKTHILCGSDTQRDTILTNQWGPRAEWCIDLGWGPDTLVMQVIMATTIGKKKSMESFN